MQVRFDEQRDDQPPGLESGAARTAPRGPGLIGKLFAGLAGAMVLVLSFVFSLVVFSVLLAVGVVVLAYFWWKTREVRKQMREQMQAQASAQRAASERVIEGEVIRD